MVPLRSAVSRDAPASYNKYVLNLPVTSTIAVLLDLLGIDINIATLGKVSWQILHGGCSAFSNALVVTVICLVGAGH